MNPGTVIKRRYMKTRTRSMLLVLLVASSWALSGIRSVPAQEAGLDSPPGNDKLKVGEGTDPLAMLGVATRAGSQDRSFDATAGGQFVGPSSGPGHVACLALQSDGRVVIGGDFVGVNARPRAYIGRLRADGQLDDSFSPGLGADGMVQGLALQADGRIVAVGSFMNFNGTPCGAVIRLNPNGSVDAAFAPPAFDPLSGYPTCVAVQGDGKMLLGGYFSMPGSKPRRGIVRLNPDGGVDTGFDPSAVVTKEWPNILSITLQPDGRILIGGQFGDQQHPLARLNPDGSADLTFEPPRISHSNDMVWIYSMALESGGRIYAGGRFDKVEGTARHCVARLHPNGTLDTGFEPGAIGSDLPVITRVAVQTDGKLVVGGRFFRMAGLDRLGLARLESNGALDTSFDPESNVAQPDHMPFVNELLVRPDGRLLVAAGFSPESCCPVMRSVCVLKIDGSLDPGFAVPEVAAPGHVRMLAAQRDGKLLISQEAGSSYNSQARVPLARLNRDGTLDGLFRTSFTGDRVSACLVQPDGKIVLGDTSFMFPDGSYQRALLRLNSDGSIDPSFRIEESLLNYDQGDDFYVNNLVRQPDGKIIVGGCFRTIRGAAREYLARLNRDGTVDRSFEFVPPMPLETSEYTTPVLALALEANGKLLVSAFTMDWQDHLLRLSASGAVEQDLSEAINGSVWQILVQPDKKILVSGSFDSAGEWMTLQRLNPGGDLDSGFHPAFQRQIQALALQANGKILISWAGSDVGFTRLNYDGSVDTAFTPDLWQGTRPGYANGIVVQPDGQILISDGFSRIEGIPWYGIARLNSGDPLITPWVWREIDGLAVQLDAIPPAGSSVYAVEEQLPTGLAATNITGEGTWDAQTGKVKFGPFFDEVSSTFGYELLPPPGFMGMVTLFGAASADGSDGTVGGESEVFFFLAHPADVVSPTWTINIGEVTAYGAAWRRGQTWVQAPNPIPMDYVTRAAFIWRKGECYRVEPGAWVAPLCWVPCLGEDGGVALRADLATSESAALAGDASTRQPNAFIPGEPITINIAIRPSSSVNAYAVEDQFPAGWYVTSIGDGGQSDDVNGRVKWGPFFDRVPRTLSYQATPPPTAAGRVRFSGACSFDGSSVVLGGPREMREACRLAIARSSAQGGLGLVVAGRSGACVLVETSTNLLDWAEVTTFTNSIGRIEIDAPQRPERGQRFYRTRLIQ